MESQIGAAGNKVKSQVDKMSRNMGNNIDAGSKTCPLVSECRNVAQGISQGDLKNVAVNGGLLSLYAVSGAAHTLDAKVNMGISTTIASAAAFVSAG